MDTRFLRNALEMQMKASRQQNEQLAYKIGRQVFWSLCSFATLVLAILKLAGVIDWQWWLVFSPILIPLMGVIGGQVLIFAFKVVLLCLAGLTIGIIKLIHFMLNVVRHFANRGRR